MEIIGKEVIERLKKDINRHLENARKEPQIAIVLNTSDEASVYYAGSIEKTGTKNGFQIKIYKVDENTTEEEIKRVLTSLADDDNIDGIVITKPYIPRMPYSFVNIIPQWKDIDGQTDKNIVALYKGEEGLYPATPLAVMEFFNEVGYSLRGKNVVIIGRSRTVGLPLFHMILRRDGTPTVCHSKSGELERFTRNADVVISAAGVPGLITAEMVPNASFLIDVGINVLEDGKIVGDMNLQGIEERDEEVFYTPVPGGVGPVTIYMLLINTLKGMIKRGKISP